MLKNYKVAHYGWDSKRLQWFYFQDGSFVRPKPWWSQGIYEHLEIWEQWEGDNVKRTVILTLLTLPKSISYYS